MLRRTSVVRPIGFPSFLIHDLNKTGRQDRITGTAGLRQGLLFELNQKN
jgi:hypothetical protein